MHGEICGDSSGDTGMLVMNESESLIISGTSTFTSSNGYFNLQGIIVTGVPGTTYYPKFVTGLVDEDRFVIMTGQSTEAYYFPISLRVCVPGEILKDNMCNPCEKGFYSFFTTDTECIQCMDGATCWGGNTVEVYLNYWRSNTSSALVYECFSEYAC